MQFESLREKHVQDLLTMVPRERLSMGESNLDLHSRDQSHHTPTRPEAVIWPKDRSEVSGVLRYANDNWIPVTAWGAGSSLEGNPIPLYGGIVLDFSLMNRIIDIREEDFQADVEPGVVYKALNERLRHKGLFFPPDPGANATIGGMIANNASGTRTVRYGSTKDHILRLSVALANGEILDMGTRASKSSSGYDLIHLFVGSEGTLGIVLQATVRLVGLPPESSAAMAAFPSIEAAGKAVFEIIRGGLNPATLELLDPECVNIINREKHLGLKVLPTLFMEYHGTSKGQMSEVVEMAHDISMSEGCLDFRAGMGRAERDRILGARYELGEMIFRANPGYRVLSMDIAVPITAYPEIISRAQDEVQKRGLVGYTFSHAGDGNIHLLLAGKEGDQEQWATIEEVSESMVLNALSLGGTATGEHGVGIGKRKFMEVEHGKALEWMKRIKGLFDPKGILNPGKIFP